ncbi:MAG: CHAT domain-containing protein [Gallionella sp.]
MLFVRVLPCLFLMYSFSAHALPYSVYTDIGLNRYHDAEKTLEQNIKNLGEADASALAPLCYVYARLKRYGKLFECTDRLDLRIKAGDNKHTDSMFTPSPIEALPDTLRAVASLELGNPDDAIEKGRKAYALIREAGVGAVFPPVAFRVELLPVLAIASVMANKREDAEKYLATLLATDVPYIGGQQFRNMKDVGLAKVYLALGNHEKAHEFLKKGEHDAFSRAVVDSFIGGGGDSVSTFYNLPKYLMLGKVLFETGKLKEARETLDALIGHKRVEEQPDIYWVALMERGRLAERESDPKAADYYRRAIEVIEQQRSSINTEAAKIGFAGDKQKVYSRVIDLLFQSGRYAEAFEYIERSKSRALVDMLAEKKDFAVAGADPEKAKLVLAQLERADSNARLLTAAPAPDMGMGAGMEYRNLEAARRDIQATAPELSTLVTVSSVPTPEIQRLLAEDEQLIEYYYQGSALFIFVVDKRAVRAVKLDAPDLTRQARQFSDSVGNPSSTNWPVLAKALYSRLVEPVKPFISGNKLLVVAHGALHYMPFNVLMRDDGSMLIEHYTIRMLPSASILKFLKPSIAQNASPILVIGNPDLGDQKLNLAFAENEAKSVAGQMAGSRLLLRKDATESNFRNAAGLFSHIHFATHGKFQAGSPLDSGLYLAADGENDGMLRVTELYSMQINADLVTLSACETGLGKISNGDDVVGLARGFLFAGARSVVSTLWSVDDRATSELMLAFYQNLKGNSKPEALRKAQLKTLVTFPHPFFWAAFQFTGRAD